MYMRAEKGLTESVGKLFSWHYNGFLADARSQSHFGCKKMSVHRYFFYVSSRPATLANVFGCVWALFYFGTGSPVFRKSDGPDGGAPIRPSTIQVRASARTFRRRVERIWQLVHRVASCRASESWLFSFFLSCIYYISYIMCIYNFLLGAAEGFKSNICSKHVVPGMFMSGRDVIALLTPDDAYVFRSLNFAENTLNYKTTYMS